ncbi:hypothetical protein BBK36DRAFT_1160860 [Trichoderma citrinoviride]|uniref:Uncharacterized protein n=1 Tax=Trichoderma citrinoviride TaxID=58853 RepID=A0A2T4B5Z4_9HYPO|nr:hypothetical protein BBK36DRAFT_1160860 [Trichoderma citrinoviride]PTB64698.1 hypothetical protein BBK36DRAFT_1160860 [Trichoderma citrinoviride]
MSTPRNKRQFAGASADPTQRQITSFFTTSGNTSSSNNNSAPEPALRGPVLPANVQANLLSVGMRVRKSVPEGYKTTTTKSSDILVWNDARSGGAPGTKTVATRPVGAKELLPFCGINKVGGMDTQPGLGYDGYDEEDVPALDQVPELSMSQESTDSVAESSGPTRKRFFDEQDEDVSFWDGEGDGAGNNNSRTIAVPHSRMKKPSATLKAVVDQENMVLDDDFEDANFLVYDSEKSMDMSV